MKIRAGTMVVTLFLALPATVLALATETVGNAPMVNQPDWAEGILNVVNLESRVYSYWVNGNESFFYRGNAQARNEAFRKYAAIKADVRQLILLPGSRKTHTFGRKPIGFDWQLHVPSGIYKAVSRRKRAVMTVYVSGLKPRPLERKQVAQWLEDLNSESFKTRAKADQELQKLGNDAKPFLREALKAQQVIEARRRIERLLERLHDVDVTDLEIPRGITVLSVEDLLAVHLKALNDPNTTVCGMAIQDLSQLAPYNEKVVPALIEMLKKDKNEYVRRVAAACLARAGVQAKSAVPVLKQGLNDPDANIRNAFQTAREQIENAKTQPGQEECLNKELAILKEINEFKKAAGGSN